MANNTNPNRTSLATRIAAEKAHTAKLAIVKQKAASALTIAKTLLPKAPAKVQFKFAEALMGQPHKALTSALRQTAVNAHNTHMATEFQNVTKMELNAFLENPSALTKEQSAVAAEIKGDAKNASGKTADDRKECAQQPEKYDEGTRTEPTGMDASNVNDADQKVWTEGGEGKVAAAKTACGEDCKGCDSCKKEAAADKKDEKTAAAKVAEEGDEPAAEAEAAPAPAEGEGETGAEESADLAENEEGHEDAADADAAEGADDAAAGDEEGADNAETEVFDEEQATLADAIEDVKSDVEVLEDAIENEIGDAEDINLTDEAQDGDDMFASALEAEGLSDADAAAADAAAGDDITFGTEGADGGEALDVSSIFADDNLSDKVSALKDEGIEAIEDFFGPSDPADLEGVLDQEESLMSPADMFAVDESTGADPMAMLFASSSKQAGEDAGILKPGTLDSHFESDLAGEDRDSASDHDGDIFADVLKSLKPEDGGFKRDKQDSEPELKESGKTAAPKGGKKVAGKKKSLTLAAHFDPMTAATKVAGGNLASLLFPDDADFA